MADNRIGRKSRKEAKDITPVYETLAILDEKKKTPQSNVTIPPVSSVKEAKDWVDANQK